MDPANNEQTEILRNIWNQQKELVETLRSEMGELRSELKSEMGELRSEMGELRTETRLGFQLLDARFESFLSGAHGREHSDLRQRVDRIEAHLGLDESHDS